MGLFIDCRFLFEVQLLCLSLHIEVLSFEDSEWSRGCKEKSAKWKIGTLTHIFFSLSSIEGRKQRRRPETFCAVYGDNAIGESPQENGFLVLRRIVLTLVILHVQEDVRGLVKIVQTH